MDSSLGPACALPRGKPCRCLQCGRTCSSLSLQKAWCHIEGFSFIASCEPQLMRNEQGDLVTVHPINERDPVPLAVHHHPVTTTFAMFQVWNQILQFVSLATLYSQMAGSTETLTVCEPGRLEEDVMMGKMVIGVNAYREVCTLHLAGQVIFQASTY